MLNALLLTIAAGLSTLVGGLAILFIRKTRAGYLHVAMGFSAGVLIFISFAELLRTSLDYLGYLPAIVAFFAGMLAFYLIDVFIPHSYEEENRGGFRRGRKCNLKRTGLLIAIGIAIHNFPEGIAVFFSSFIDIKVGMTIALAIALHNIPEGIAVAMPIYYATGSRVKALWYSFLAGVAEPVGALVAFLFLQPYINEMTLNVILAAVAGIMVFISFDELLPRAYKRRNVHPIILGIFFGMVVAALSLQLLA